MPEHDIMVVNTGPILAIKAALGDLRIFQMYSQVLVPLEVAAEIEHGGSDNFAVKEFLAASWIQKIEKETDISIYLRNVLDIGEAAVIQTALNRCGTKVCIDEACGRRIARLHNLKVTGSIGVLLRALREGYEFSMEDALYRMRERGVWLSDQVIAFALREVKPKCIH